MEINLSVEEKRDMQEILFCSQLLQEKELVRLTIYAKKRFNIVGNIEKKIFFQDFLMNNYRGIVFIMMNHRKDKITVIYDNLTDFSQVEGSDLIKITKLRLEPRRIEGDAQLFLKTTSYTKITPVIPDLILEKNGENMIVPIEKCISTQKSRKISEFSIEKSGNLEPIWPLLQIDLHKYAENTEEGVKFQIKSLVNISDRVKFLGIVTNINKKSESWTNCYYFELRDLLTNDSLSLYVNYSKPEEDSFLESIQKFDILQVNANRMISKKLSIFFKLTLNLVTHNLEIYNRHRDCTYKFCPCSNPKNVILPNFAPFSFLSDIKPFTLFRIYLRIYLRVVYVNFISFKLHCKNCEKIVYQKENFCCEDRSIEMKIFMGVLIEDSTAVADGLISSFEVAKELLQMDKSIENELTSMAQNEGEVSLKHTDFPSSFKRHLKNLGPMLRFCVVRPEVKLNSQIKNDGNSKVWLNSSRCSGNVNVRIFKVDE